MKPSERKRNIPMFIAGILLCLTLLSMYLVSGLYAKFTTSGEGEDSARVAAFYLEAEGDLCQYIMTDVLPGEEQNQELLITNRSEVKLQYTLTIYNETKNLPLTFLLRNTVTEQIYNPQNNTITVESTLEPGNRIDHFSLTADWPASDEAIDPNLAFAGMVDSLAVTIHAVQID